MRRREFLAVATAGGASMVISPESVVGSTRNAVGADERFEVLDFKTISRVESGYCGWPTLAQRANGELLLAYSGGRQEHVCPFGRVELMRSKDRGETWEEPQVVLDTPIDDRDAGVLETRKGTLLVTTFTSLAYVPTLEKAIKSGSWPEERLARWRSAHERLDASGRQRMLGVWMIRSTDDGATWSPPADCLVNSPHGPVELADGRLLYAGKDLWREGDRVGFCHSADDGVSWEWLAELPIRSGDSAANYHELHVIEAKPGRLVAHIRNHNSRNQGETLQSESDDGGETWTEPHSIGVWGLPSHLLRLADGRLMMSYGHRRKPLGNQVRLSGDAGKSWSEPLVLQGDAASGDLGYTSSVQIEPDVFVTVWYEKDAALGRAVLRQMRWRCKV